MCDVDLVSDRTEIVSPGLSKNYTWNWQKSDAADFDVCASTGNYREFDLAPGQETILTNLNPIQFNQDTSGGGRVTNKHEWSSDGWHWTVESTIRVSIPWFLKVMFDAPTFMTGTISVNLDISRDWTKYIKKVTFDLSSILARSYFGSYDMSNRVWSVAYVGITKAAWRAVQDLHVDFNVEWYYGDKTPWADIGDQYVSISVDWDFHSNRTTLSAPFNSVLPLPDDSEWDTDDEGFLPISRFG